MFARRLTELFSFLSPEVGDEDTDVHGPDLHRLDPILFLALFDSLQRYDAMLADRLASEFNIDQQNLVALASNGEPLGPGHLSDFLDALDHHHRYADIVILAGRNAFSLQAVRDGSFRRLPLPQLPRAVRRRMQPFIGEASLDIELRGRVLMLRITNSIFAHGRFSLNSLCGFYVGYLQQLGRDCGLRRLDAREARCACQDEDDRCCLIQAAL